MPYRGPDPRKGIGSKAWAELRRQCFEAAGWRCVDCGRPGRLEADHIIPLVKGGLNELRNLAARCRGCHIEKTRRDFPATPAPGVNAWRELLARRRADHEPNSNRVAGSP